MLGQLNDIQIQNVLTSQVVGRLACTNSRQPYIVPVTYAYDGHYIYGQSNEGMKLDLLRKNPNVCFEVDVMTDMRNWKSVVVTGKFEEINPAKAQKVRGILFGRNFQLMTSSAVHAHEHEVKALPDDSNRIKKVFYRIKIKKMMGRYETQ